MDANSFVLLAAVAAVMSFNLTASLMCCRSLSRRVDRLEDRLDARIDRIEQRMDRMEQRMDRMEQMLQQLAIDLALIKGQMGITPPQPAPAAGTLAVAEAPVVASPSAAPPASAPAQ